MLAELDSIQEHSTLKSKTLNRLSRITSPGRNFIPQIDGLRFVAIMAVIAYHVRGICLYHFGVASSPEATSLNLDPVSRTFATGHFGVELFFAISGFILSLPFAKQYLCDERRITLREYYIRRLTRIEPPYLIHLAFLFVLCGLVLRHQPSHQSLYQNPAWMHYTLAHILPSLVYANGFVFGAHPYPNAALWSLEVEVQFYLVAPFLSRVFLIRNRSIRRELIASLVVLFSFFNLVVHNYRVNASLAGNLQYFLIGFLVADLYLTEQVPILAPRPTWDLAALLSCVAVIWGHELGSLVIFLPWAILLGFLGTFRGLITTRVLSHPWVTTVGGMCYTIYMYHWLLISLLVRITAKLQTHVLWLDLLIQFVLMSMVIIPLCAVVFAFLERPFMRRNWPSKLYLAIRPTKAAA